VNLVFILALWSNSHFSPPLLDTGSKENFVNEISSLVIDSSFSGYYLLEEANPCNFKRFDYDEWVKYGLQQSVPFLELNELSYNASLDTTRDLWIARNLSRAICISPRQAQVLLDPAREIKEDSTLSASQKKKRIRKIMEDWVKKPLEQRVVYYISKPAYTNDHHFAVVNVVYRCDDRGCGLGATYLFSQGDGGWTIAGKLVSWSD